MKLLLFLSLGLLFGCSLFRSPVEEPSRIPSDPMGEARQFRVSVFPERPQPGSLFSVELDIDPGVEAASVRFLGREHRLTPVSSYRFRGVLGIDLEEKRERLPLKVIVGSSTWEIEIELSRRKDGVEYLTLPSDQVDLSPDDLERVLREQAELQEVWQSGFPKPLWEEPFQWPIEASMGAPFGIRRIINGEERNPHSGVDLKAPYGTEVRAANAGRVTFVGDQFFGGRTVVLDHGGGIFSLYLHLSRVFVAEGEWLERGASIGEVGATGRATGPHLHWGAHFYERRVDPLSLLQLPGWR